MYLLILNILSNILPIYLAQIVEKGMLSYLGSMAQKATDVLSLLPQIG